MRLAFSKIARVWATTSPAPMMLPASSTGCTEGRNTTPPESRAGDMPGPIGVAAPSGPAVTSISIKASGRSRLLTGTVSTVGWCAPNTSARTAAASA